MGVKMRSLGGNITEVWIIVMKRDVLPLQGNLVFFTHSWGVARARSSEIAGINRFGIENESFLQ